MQIFGPLLAIAGLAAALPGGDGGYGGNPGYSPKKDCVTSSTCKAVYRTYTSTVPYKATKHITTTEYKPVTYTTKVEKVYTETKYIPSQFNITKTIPVTKTITVPDYSTTVICKTETVNFNRTSIAVKESYSTCPQETHVPATKVIQTWIPKTVTTSTPCPYTTKNEHETHSTTICTETTSECKPVTSCETKPPSYPTNPPKYDKKPEPPRYDKKPEPPKYDNKPKTY